MRIDDDEIELGIRKHTDDKLTYKLIIANAINECRRTEGHRIKYPNNVKALWNIIYFKVKGYNFSTQLDEIKKKLDDEKKTLWENKKQNLPRWKFYSNKYQAQFKDKLDREYWEGLFREILQLLASEGLLIDIEKYISVRSNE